MRNTKSAWVTCFGIILFLLVWVIAFGISNTRISEENNALINELNAVKESLLSTENELSTTKENLRIEVSKYNELSNELMQTRKDLNAANTIIEALKDEEYVVGFTVTNTEINMLAKTVWGEARGTNKMEQSAVIWCILNRVDAGWGSISEVITAPNQFHGYSPNFPVTDEIRALVEDVVARWKFEKACGGNVGRTLPSNYLYFRADSTGLSNVFRTEWDGNYEVWNWDCWNPYE